MGDGRCETRMDKDEDGHGWLVIISAIMYVPRRTILVSAQKNGTLWPFLTLEMQLKAHDGDVRVTGDTIRAIE